MGIEFEYDSAKSKANKDKHGIDFLEAQALWDDENALTLPSAHPYEERYLTIGKIEECFWTAITTLREENIRIISVRRSRKEEIQLYE